LISLSLLSTAHRPHFQLRCVRSSRRCYPPFNLAMDRSLRFRVYRTLLCRPVQTRFRSGSTSRLNLATYGNSQAHYAKGTRSHGVPCDTHRALTACRRTVSGSLSLPSPGFFSPFPRGTSSLSVSEEYLALRDGPRGFPPDCSCPAVLGYRLGPLELSLTGLSPSLAGLSMPFC
jgi:hypothetical protein